MVIVIMVTMIEARAFDVRQEKMNIVLIAFMNEVTNSEMITLIAKYILTFLHELTISSNSQSNALTCLGVSGYTYQRSTFYSICFNLKPLLLRT